MAKKEPEFEGRIRYVEDWNGRGEYFLFENKWTNEEEWGLEIAFKLLDYGDEKGEVVNYRALTTIREWQRLGMKFHFGK